MKKIIFFVITNLVLLIGSGCQTQTIAAYEPTINAKGMTQSEVGTLLMDIQDCKRDSKGSSSKQKNCLSSLGHIVTN